MTWQRIDDDTYIDDSLVTCAEYQLFIDEMREQGKYYQPDHWTSYQFHEGQARDPILGVRHNYAEEFCHWLTQRDNGAWRYSIPTIDDANRYSLKLSPELLMLGYWINNIKDTFRFAWVGDVPKDPRNITTSLLEIFDNNNIQASEFIYNQAAPLDLSSLLNRGYDFDQSILPVLEHSINYFSKQSNENSSFYLAYTIKYSLTRAKTKNSYQDAFLALFIDLLTLQERIAGRSPAFEGIRLVKERIK